MDQPSSTVNRELSTLSHLFRRAEMEMVEARIAPTIEKSAEAQKQITILSPEQQQDLARCDNRPRPAGLAIRCNRLNAAMRHSEILRIRFDQIDFADRRFYVPEARQDSASSLSRQALPIC
ncbi:MAG: hypothetical protein IPH79_14600 [Sphingomonadales bacterium]|nr:hypothetical protein [Sphingomonadales bacterium]